MNPETDETAPFDADALLAELDADEAAPSPDETPDPTDAPVETQTSDGQAQSPADAAASASPDEAAAQDSPESPAATADSPDTTEPDAPQPEPFAFTADAKRVTVEGATVAGDTITMSREAWARQVQPHLADRGTWARQKAGLEQQLKQKSVAEGQAQALVQSIQGLAQMDEEQAIQWALDMRSKMPTLLKDAEIAVLKAQHAPLVEQQQAQQAQLSEQEVEQWLDASIHHFLDTPPFQDVRGDTRFLERAKRVLGAAFPSYLGPFKDGQYQTNWPLFQALLTSEADDARAVTKQQAEQAAALKKYEAAAKANALKTKAKPVPPTISGGKAAGTTQPSAPASREEWDKELDELANEGFN